MPTVNFKINSKDYSVDCGAGQEAQILSIARTIDERASELARRFDGVDNETLLLEAWKEKRIAAAICWDSTAKKSFPQTEPIILPRTDVLATPLSLCDLAGGADYQIMEQLAIFALSEKGQAIFTQFGYKTK